MTTKRRALFGNLIFGILIAAGVAALLYRTDPDLVAQKAAEPYATVEILPDSLEQHPIEGSSHWGLFYTIKTMKLESCDEVLVERIIQRIGEAFPVANNRDIAGEMVAPSSEERITKGLHVRLPGPLGPGDYFLLLRSTCYIADPETGIKAPIASSAEAFVCFRVPDRRSLPIMGPQRLQPVSENCKRELAEIVLNREHRRFVMSR